MQCQQRRNRNTVRNSKRTPSPMLMDRPYRNPLTIEDNLDLLWSPGEMESSAFESTRFLTPSETLLLALLDTLMPENIRSRSQIPNPRIRKNRSFGMTKICYHLLKMLGQSRDWARVVGREGTGDGRTSGPKVRKWLMPPVSGIWLIIRHLQLKRLTGIPHCPQGCELPCCVH